MQTRVGERQTKNDKTERGRDRARSISYKNYQYHSCTRSVLATQNLNSNYKAVHTHQLLKFPQ